MKWLVHSDDIVAFELERVSAHVFIHCRVRVWSRGKWRHISKVLETIGNMLWLSGVRVLMALAPTQKTAKFAMMCGFKKIKTIEGGGELMSLQIEQPEEVGE